MNLYTIEELKSLPIDAEVFVTYEDNENNMAQIEKVILKDENYIYFTDGIDFPLYDNIEVRTEFAVQDTGDYIFKVYKINT